MRSRQDRAGRTSVSPEQRANLHRSTERSSGEMNAATLIQLSLLLAQTVLDELKSGKATDTASQVIADLESAVAALQKVQGTDVTFQQLESLRTTPKW